MLTRVRAAKVTWLNVRLTLAFTEASRLWIDEDLISSLLIAGVMSANVEATQQHPTALRRHPGLGDVPDDLRRPVNTLSLAMSLGIPRETARSKLAALVTRGVLERRGDGVLLGSNVIQSDPFVAAVSSFLQMTSEFIDGLAALEACGVLHGDHLASPPGSFAGVASRLVVTHILRGIDYAVDLNPDLGITTQFILLSLAQLSGASLQVVPDVPRDGGRLAPFKPGFSPVRIAELSRFTRLPHETVRRHVARLEQRGIVCRQTDGWRIDLSDPAVVSRWLDFQTRTKIGTRQLVWKLLYAGVIVRSPVHGLTVNQLFRC